MKNCLILTLLLLAAAVNFAQSVKLPAPTGGYPVGTTVFYLTDHSRKMPLAAESERFREMAVQIWYPADKTNKQENAAYLINPLLPAVGNLSFVSAQKKSAPKKPEMVFIKGATFEMGTDKADIPKLQEVFQIKRAALFEEETPRRPVTIDSFYLEKYEVTNREFKTFLNKNPEWRKDKLPAGFHSGKYLQDWNENDFPPDKADHPVVFVIWYAAVAYCQALGRRLPTEAEWEYAARGGLAGKQFPWGDELPDKTRANFGASGLGTATRVGTFAPNGYGLFDMAGNVWEFLADEWKLYPASTELQVNPVAGGDFFSGDSYRQVKTRRVIRGGSYGGAAVNLRVTYRDSHAPENAGDHVGFRCAQNAGVKNKQ